MGTHLRSNTDGAHAAEQGGTGNSLPPTRTAPCGGVIRPREISGEGRTGNLPKGGLCHRTCCRPQKQDCH
ncbi:MAG: hypothetical protein J6S82_10135 [Bacteroidales bacterium]|nr:hypothetical protein [Bacteroidales bacterium]